MVETHTFNISMIKQFGEVSERKIKALSNSGLNFVHSIPGHIAQFMDPESNNAIVIGQNQLTYGVNGADNVEKVLQTPGMAVEMFMKVLDILMVDDSAQFQVKFERSYDSNMDSAQRSLELLDNGNDFAEIAYQGIGLRIPVKENDIYGEIRIEPFFGNSEKYFLGCTLQCKEPIPGEEADELIKNMITTITSNFEPLVHRLYG